MKRSFLKLTAAAFALIMLAVSCGEEVFLPKQRGFFRLQVPEHAYVPYDTACPFTFERSVHSVIVPYNRGNEQHPCWFNAEYPRFDATIYYSYERLDNNLKEYIDDSHMLVYKHVIKASGISESLVIDTATHVYGTVYNIDGDPACPYQFYLTDSTEHFFRGALYFNFKPNYDSLAPVLEFLKADMDHVVQTFEWKKPVKK